MFGTTSRLVFIEQGFGYKVFSVPILLELLCSAKVEVKRTYDLVGDSISVSSHVVLMQGAGGGESERLPVSSSLCRMLRRCLVGQSGLPLRGVNGPGDPFLVSLSKDSLANMDTER